MRVVCDCRLRIVLPNWRVRESKYVWPVFLFNPSLSLSFSLPLSLPFSLSYLCLVLSCLVSSFVFLLSLILSVCLCILLAVSCVVLCCLLYYFFSYSKSLVFLFFIPPFLFMQAHPPSPTWHRRRGRRAKSRPPNAPRAILLNGASSASGIAKINFDRLVNDSKVYLVLSCYRVLSYAVLCCVVFSCLVLSCRVLPCVVLCCVFSSFVFCLMLNLKDSYFFIVLGVGRWCSKCSGIERADSPLNGLHCDLIAGVVVASQVFSCLVSWSWP